MLAPLAGISDYPFRQMCREFGADLTFTEMVSIDGLLYDNGATRRLLTVHPDEEPVGFQFFGSDPELFGRVIPEVENLNPAVIDLNFGCPVRKVVAKGAGSALLKNIDRMRKIVEVVKGATKFPVTAKIRIGWNQEMIVAEEAALAVEAGGADAITVHARTRSQGYSGHAQWEYIARVKQALKIPVIGNGDVFDAQSAQEMFRTTGVDGIMLARGALGHPWIFSEILGEKGDGATSPETSVERRFQIMMKHYRLEVEEFGETVALSRMKKHFGWYTHGLPGASVLRNQIFRAKEFQELEEILESYRKNNIHELAH